MSEHVCIVCRRLLGRITPVDGADARVPVAMGLVGVYACETHREKISLVTEVTGAAARAGVDTALEKRAPELKKKIARVLRALRDQG